MNQSQPSVVIRFQELEVLAREKGFNLTAKHGMYGFVLTKPDVDNPMQDVHLSANTIDFIDGFLQGIQYAEDNPKGGQKKATKKKSAKKRSKKKR
jgi:hypothetical protein